MFPVSPWFWLVAAALFAVLEAVTTQLVSIWFCAGAAAALLTAYLTPSFQLQLAVFLVVSAIALVVSKALGLGSARMKNTPTNADMVLGQEGTALTEITPLAPGRVRVNGQDWAAQCAQPLAAGQQCRVLSLSGVTLTVAPVLEQTGAAAK